MNRTQPQPPQTETSTSALVIERNQQEIRLLHGGTKYDARRSFSCLVEPEAGDRVLFTRDEEGTCWVLAILERTTKAPSVLRMDRDCTLQVTSGNLRLLGEKSVTTASPGTVAVHSSTYAVSSREGRIFCDNLVQSGSRLVQRFTAIKAVGRTFDIIFERFAQRLKNSYRTVEQVDSSQAGDLDVRTKRTATIRAKNTLFVADELFKADAGQIHIG